jgi:hypothetical protein
MISMEVAAVGHAVPSVKRARRPSLAQRVKLFNRIHEQLHTIMEGTGSGGWRDRSENPGLVDQDHRLIIEWTADL